MSVLFRNAYLSSLRWFSVDATPSGYAGGVSEALRRHVRYIRRGRLTDSDKDFIRVCLSELDRRVNARVAAKIFFTLPNEFDDRIVAEFVRDFMRFFGSEYIFAVHRCEGSLSGKQNTHVHVVLSTRDGTGKKIRLGRRDLSKLHSHYRSLLVRFGHEPLTNPFGPQQHLGPLVHFARSSEACARVVELREKWRLSDRPRPSGPARSREMRKVERRKEIIRRSPDYFHQLQMPAIEDEEDPDGYPRLRR